MSRVNLTQAALSITIVTVGTVFFPVAAVVVPIAGVSGWLSVLGAFVIAIPWAFMAGSLVSLAPTGHWGQAVRIWLGPWVGQLFLLYFAFVWAWLGSFILGQGGQVFHAIALPATPPAVLTGALLLLLVLADLRGVEVFARSLEIIFMISIPLAIALIAGVTPSLSLQNMQPFLGEPPIRLAHATMLCLPWAMEGILFTLFIGSHVKNNKNLGKVGAASVLLGGVFLTMVTAITLAVLGRTVVELQIYPSLAAAQVVHLGSFLQGLEVLLFPLWLLASYVKAGASFILVSESLRGVYEGFRQPYRAIAVGILFMGIAMMPANPQEVVSALSRVDNTFFMSFYILLPIILIWAKVTKSRGGVNEQD